MAIDLNAQDGRGRTALHRAVLDHNPAAVKQLLDLGANPEIRDYQGRKGFTPLYYAACQTADHLSVLALKNAQAQVDETMRVELIRQAQAEPLNRTKRDIRTILEM